MTTKYCLKFHRLKGVVAFDTYLMLPTRSNVCSAGNLFAYTTRLGIIQRGKTMWPLVIFYWEPCNVYKKCLK